MQESICLVAGSRPPSPGKSLFPTFVTSRNLHECLGAIHIHSVYSDGSGSVEEIVSAAEGTGVDFLVLTDHNSLEARESGYEGWHDHVLLIVGDEVSSKTGHCLALGTSEHVNHRQDLSGILKGIREKGGHSYIAHPHGRYRPILRMRDHGWKDWQADTATGMELWSYMFDWASSFHYFKFPRYYRDPDACLNGPSAETVAKWDELCQRRRVVALGGVDTHARKYPLLPFVVFPYREQFATLRTHLLCPNPLVRDARQDIPNVLSTLAAGRCFLAMDKLADASGTRFQTTDGDLIMGEEAVFERTVELEILLPLKADITLVRNGVGIKTVNAESLNYRADVPGVYRVEAKLDGRPWLYTNPIYLRSHPPDR